MEGFGSRLVKARTKKGLTQKKFAELLEISPTRLNYWEKDKREPDLFMFNKIVSVLGIDANELLGLNFAKNSIDAKKYNSLNILGKQKADEYINDLTENPKYTHKEKNITLYSGNYEIAAWGAEGTEGTFKTPPEETT